MVYFHASAHAVLSIPIVFQYSSILLLYSGKPASNIPVIVPVVFQYCRPILNFSIPLTVTPSPLSFFNFFTDACFIFLIWCHFFHSRYVYQLSNSQFSSYLFLCVSFRNFYCFIPVFHSIIPVPVPSFAFLFSVSRFSVSMRHAWLFFRFLRNLEQFINSLEPT